MNIKKADLNDLDILEPLFVSYLIFYGEKADPAKVSQFLKNRIQNNDSTIFLALDSKNKGLGFTQVYPSFSS